MNVPKLRFKGFSDEYIELKLKDICLFYSGGTPISSNRNFYTGYVPFIRSGEIHKAKTELFVTDEAIKNSSAKYVKKGDLLFALYGATSGDVAISKINGVINQAILCIKPQKFYNQIYIKYLLELNKKSILNKYIQGGQGNLSANIIKNIKFNFCSFKEQSKVANFLLLLDKKIELQVKKIEALKLFKKGLFDIQLKINGKESIMFDDFLDEVTEKSSIQNQYPVLSSTSKGLFLQSDYFNKQASSENNVGYKILKRNQLVLSPQNLWMGNININNIFDIGIVSPSYRVYNIDIKKMDLNYFNYWIKTPKALYSYLISSEQGASIVRRNLNIEMFNQISLKVPKLEKQHIIGNKIYQFNLKINFEEEKLKQLHKLKKALLQNMFV